MNRRPPTSTRPNTPFPSPTVFRAHHLPRLQPLGGLHTAAVDADLALAQQLLEAPVGHLGKVLAEPTVEALAGGCRLHRDLTHASRSEEHTSELQSLMRNSSTVFCLKKKKIYITSTNTLHNTH